MGALSTETVGQKSSFSGLNRKVSTAGNNFISISNGLSHRDNVEVSTVSEIYDLYNKITILMNNYGELIQKDSKSFATVADNQKKIDESYGK